MTNLDMIRGRSTALTLTNRSGAARSQGDLVIVDTTNDESFTTSTTSNTKTIIGIVDETIGITSNGRVVVEGYARAVKTLGTSARGDYLYHSTTAATAGHLAGSAPEAGAFGYVLDGGSGTLTTAIIFPTEQGGGVTSISHTSNTFTGAVTLTASGTLGITSPAAGTFTLSATGGAGGGGADNPVTWTAGTSMPGSPTTNQRITRTDLGLDFYWDGTRWLGIDLLSAWFDVPTGVAPWTVNQSVLGPANEQDFDWWLVNLHVSFSVTTTNNGTNYWTYTVTRNGGAGGTVVTGNTSAAAASTWTKGKVAIGALAGTTAVGFDMGLAKTLSPGSIYWGAAYMTYRRVGT